jgi:hypothetical protein
MIRDHSAVAAPFTTMTGVPQASALECGEARCLRAGRDDHGCTGEQFGEQACVGDEAPKWTRCPRN